MQKYIWSLALVAVTALTIACGNGPTSPTTSTTSSSASQPASSPTANPPAGGPEQSPTPTTGNSATPVYTLTRPSLQVIRANCYKAPATPTKVDWVVNMTDSGNTRVRFKPMIQYSLTSGCDKTIENPREWLAVSGVNLYSPHSAGQTRFTYDTGNRRCGRVQVDASWDPITGADSQLVYGDVIDYGVDCPPEVVPPVVTPSCAQVTSSLVKNSEVLSTTLLDGEYTPTFSGPAGTTASLTQNGAVLAFTSGNRNTITLARPNPGEPSRVATVTLTPKIGDTTCEAKSITFTAPARDIEPPCTLTFNRAEWDQDRKAAVYNLSVSPETPNGVARAGFVIDGTTQNPSVVDLRRDLFFGYPVQDDRSHALTINASYDPGGGGLICTKQMTITIPAAPTPVCLVPDFMNNGSTWNETSNYGGGTSPTVTIDLRFVYQNYPAARAVQLFWTGANGSTRIKDSIPVNEQDCNRRVTGSLQTWQSTSPEHLPSQGAKFTARLVDGNGNVLKTFRIN